MLNRVGHIKNACLIGLVYKDFIRINKRNDDGNSDRNEKYYGFVIPE